MTLEPPMGDETQADPASAPPQAPVPRAEVQGLTPYAPGKAKVAGLNRVWKLSSNENPFGVPPGVQRAIADAAAGSFRYPDGASAELRRAIGARHGLDPERIVCGVGSDELIGYLCDAYGGPGRELVMNRHSFSMYDIYGRRSGATVVKAEERDLTADVDAMLAAVTPRTSLVFLANPDNPTGSFVPEAEVRRLRAGLPPSVLLVLDSAYAEYVERTDYDPGARLVDAGDNTVMLRTFSKAYGLGGMRIGWAYAPPAVVDILNRVRSPFNLSVVAQAAGIAALDETEWVERSRTHNTAQRAKLAAALRGCGLHVWPSEANFLLVGFGSAARAEAANRFLDARGLIVRAMTAYELPDALRITVGTEEECAMLAEALAAFQAAPG